MSLRTPAKAFKRMRHEAYYTPPHAVHALLRFADEVGLFAWHWDQIWEPAAGAGHIARVFKDLRFRVLATDLHPARVQHHPVAPLNFFDSTGPSGNRVAIITNPPYGHRNALASAFIAHAQHLMQEERTWLVALLLPFEFDAAGSRNEVVSDHPCFLRKVTVARRIRWLNLKQKKNGPMGHHAWFIWTRDVELLRRARGPGVVR